MTNPVARLGLQPGHDSVQNRAWGQILIGAGFARLV